MHPSLRPSALWKIIARQLRVRVDRGEREREALADIVRGRPGLYRYFLVTGGRLRIVYEGKSEVPDEMRVYEAKY